MGEDWLETCKLSPTVSFELSCCHSRFNFKKSSPYEMKRYNRTSVKLSRATQLIDDYFVKN